MKTKLFTKLQELIPAATNRHPNVTDVPSQFDEFGLVERWVCENGMSFASCEEAFENDIKFKLLANAPELVPTWKQYLDFRVCYKQRRAKATRALAGAIEAATGYKAADGILDINYMAQYIIESGITTSKLIIIMSSFPYAYDYIFAEIWEDIECMKNV